MDPQELEHRFERDLLPGKTSGLVDWLEHLRP